MNQTWNSFLQTVFQFVKSLFANVSKKMHRDAAVLTAGISVVTVVAFTAGDFQGGGKSALVAFAETPEQTGGAEILETDLEETGEEMPAAEEEQEEGQEEQEAEQSREASEEAPAAVDAKSGAEEVDTDVKENQDGGNAEEEAGAADDRGETSGSTGETKEAESDSKKRSAETSAELSAKTSAGTGAELSTKTGTGTSAGTGAELSTKADTGTSAEEADEESEGITLSDKDYQVLLKIVQAEAGGCDQKGRILVANVILNRVESDEFPDTVSGVVYERHQFSPVGDGSINRCKVTKETIEAVECALAGEDYSDGALYFMNRKTASGRNVRWFDNHLDYLFKHGNHEFFK